MYNKPGEDVTKMAHSLQKFFDTKLKLMPPVEMDLTQQIANPKKTTDPPKKVLPPGSSKQALANARNGGGDPEASSVTKTSTAKQPPAQHTALPPTVSQQHGKCTKIERILAQYYKQVIKYFHAVIHIARYTCVRMTYLIM